jgi:hypothetical protein
MLLRREIFNAQERFFDKNDTSAVRYHWDEIEQLGELATM